MAAKILVADDSPNIREILRMSLETDGYSVVLAEDGEQALALVGEQKPDLVIIDVMMPKVNGFQVCRRVKTDRGTRSVPVIMLTAKSGQQDVFWGKDCGADEYITKPFSTKDLAKTIARLLGLSKEQHGHAQGVLEEHRQRRARGEESQVVNLEWNPRAMDIFRKKYGEFKVSEAHRQFKSGVEEYLRDHKDPGPVELHEVMGLAIVLHGTAAEARREAGKIAGRLNQVAAALYSKEDRDRGFIPYRDPRTSQEERLPLLSFSPTLVSDQAA